MTDCLRALSSVEPTVPLTVCAGNNDEKFRPLIEKYKGIFRDASGISMVILVVICFKCLYVGQVIAYYDYQKSTIRHVQCPLQIPEVGPTKRCTYCKNHRDKVLRSSLSRHLKQQQEGQHENRSDISSHTNDISVFAEVAWGHLFFN